MTPADPTSMENARKVRWAMAMAVNRESIIENVLDGLGRVIYAWQNILPDDPSHKADWVIPYDVGDGQAIHGRSGRS